MNASSLRAGVVLFAIGAACGAFGVLAWQKTRGPGQGGTIAGEVASAASGPVLGADSADAAARNRAPEAMVPSGGDIVSGAASRTDSRTVAPGEPESGATEASDPGVADVLMQLGAAAAEGKIRSRVASLREALNLTEPQEREVAAILEESQRKQQEAMRAFLERRATIQMLPLMDGHDPDAEAALVALLDESQRDAHAAYQVEQEAERIEMKANKELVELQQMLDLSPEQKDLVFDLFTELARSEKPGSIDPSVTVDQFTTFLDGSLGVRREAMGEILTPDQATIYNEQLTNFRNFVLGSLAESQ